MQRSHFHLPPDVPLIKYRSSEAWLRGRKHSVAN